MQSPLAGHFIIYGFRISSQNHLMKLFAAKPLLTLKFAKIQLFL